MALFHLRLDFSRTFYIRKLCGGNINNVEIGYGYVGERVVDF